MCRCTYTFIISTIRHFIYNYAIFSQKHQGNRTSAAKKTRKQYRIKNNLYIEVTIKDGKLEIFERQGIEEAVV